MSQYFNERKLDEDKSKKLIVACANADREEVERLLEKIPNIEEVINEKNNMGETALHVTSTGGDHYILQNLLDNGADMTISDRDGRTPLMKATLMENVDCVQVYLANDEDNLYFAGENGELPLHCACIVSHMELVSHFVELDDEGKTIKALDKDGNTPFLCAAVPPIRVDVLEFLLENGSDINEQNNKQETALLLAARAIETKAIRFLLDQNAQIVASKTGWTAVHECAFRKNLEGLTMLLDAGADFKTPTSENETPLYLACAGGNEDCVKLLIEKGADPKKNCIFAATKFERSNVIRLLVKNKIDINQTRDDGWTALILAVDLGFTDIAQLLMDGGADPTIKVTHPDFPKKPLTAAGIAKAKGNKELAKSLGKAEKDGCIIN